MKIIGITIVIMALAVGIVPQFTNCSVQGRELLLQTGRAVPMKCYWTAKAAPAIALPLFADGIMIFFSRKKAALRVICLLGSIIGAVAILLPTELIGVCASDEMLCRLAMQPTMVFSGVVTTIAGLIGFFLAGKTSIGD
jgi:hypothetical protein